MSELDELRRDRDRLDWLGYVKHGFVRGTSVSKWCMEAPEEGIRELRQAIDVEMAAAEQTQPDVSGVVGETIARELNEKGPA